MTVGRPFTPGKSGNPGGRSKGIERQLREQLGDDLPRIASAMRDIALNVEVKESDRIKAAEWVYDRCYGKAKQSIDLSGDLAIGERVNLAPLTDLQLRALAELDVVTAASDSDD